MARMNPSAVRIIFKRVGRPLDLSSQKCSDDKESVALGFVSRVHPAA
jgi:hypothetical protein